MVLPFSFQSPERASAASSGAGSVAAQADCYQIHLDRVSRSFAYAIGTLELDLRVPVGLSYLLCRVLDTIEDSQWSSPAEQMRAYQNFDRFVSVSVEETEVKSWRARFPQAIPEGESLLLDAATALFSDLHERPEAEYRVMSSAILSMSAGMAHFSQRASLEGHLRLRSLGDVNRYCFFVAGVVGEILTGLVKPRFERVGSATGDEIAVNASRFGLFLQKINILKDQVEDEREGRFFVPSRAAVCASAGQDATFAFRYILNLPPSLADFRLFCASALFVGLASMPSIHASYIEKRLIKLPRLETLALLTRVKTMIGDNEALTRLYDSLHEKAQFGHLQSQMGPEVTSRSISDDARETEILMGVYRGTLDAAMLRDIFTGEPSS